MLNDVLSLGHGNFVLVDQIESIVTDDGCSGARKAKDQAAAMPNMLIDARHGHGSKSLVVTCSGRVYMSAFCSETLAARLRIGTAEKDGQSCTG